MIKILKLILNMTKQQKAHKNKRAPNKGHLKVTSSPSRLKRSFCAFLLWSCLLPSVRMQSSRGENSVTSSALPADPAARCALTGPALTGSCRRRVSLEGIHAVTLLETKTHCHSPVPETRQLRRETAVATQTTNGFSKEGDTLCSNRALAPHPEI